MQPVNNLFDAIIINNHRTHEFSSLGKKKEQSTNLEMFLEGHFKNEARCSLHSGIFEVYLIQIEAYRNPADTKVTRHIEIYEYCIYYTLNAIHVNLVFKD